MRIAAALYVIAFAGYSGTARAQEFEVASVKRTPPLEGAQAMAHARAQDLMQMMMPAGVKPGDVTGPGWISDLRYNIEAKLPEGADPKTRGRC